MSRMRKGFTLLELMITVAITVILVALAWPSFQDFIRRNAVIAQTNQLVASLQYARNEAVSRRSVTGICASTDDISCTSNDYTWEKGWMLWRDKRLGVPNGGAYDPSHDELLRVTQAQPNISIHIGALLGASGGVPTIVLFDQRGAVNLGVVAQPQAKFLVCAKAKPGDALGVSTARVPGKVVLITSTSGRISVYNLAAGASCTSLF